MKQLNFITIVLFLFSCGSPTSETIKSEGFIEVTGGKIWYKILGEDKTATPVIIVHGGPGSRSCNTIEGYSLLAKHRPVVLFDQLESGLSDHPNDTSL